MLEGISVQIPLEAHIAIMQSSPITNLNDSLKDQSINKLKSAFYNILT